MKPDQNNLKNLEPEKDFFVGIDSDGCVFDTMELKHKECFCPAYIDNFNLQSVSRYAREVWDFVNLYSKTRGINRFMALLKALSLLGNRKEVKARRSVIPPMKGLRSWAEKETRLGNRVLQEAADNTGDEDLLLAAIWSKDVNSRIEKMVRGIAPFPFVKESLYKISEKADSIVVSQAPLNTLKKEWGENKIDSFVKMIAGQEMGSKRDHLKLAAGNKYKADHILMIGDAPGDYKAALANGALFFPIVPGKEELSWEKLYKSGLERFFNGSFRGEYQKELLDTFEKSLPATPFWED